MTSNEEGSKPPGELSKRSNAPASKDQAKDLEKVLADIPPQILETFEKLLEQAEDDPAKLSRFRAELKWSIYRGQFPPAEIIGEYERILPGSGLWLLDRIKSQVNHRHALERLRAKAWERLAIRGQWSGLGVALFGITVSGIVAIWTGAYIFPSILAAVSVGGPTAGNVLIKSIRHLGQTQNPDK